MVQRFKALEQETSKAVDMSIQKNKPEWEQMQRDRITEGKNTEDKDLEYNKDRSSALNTSGAYTRSYSRERSKDGLQVNHVDLKRTGGYQNQIKAKGRGKKLYFESNDEKEKYIEANYDNVLGFTEEEKKQVFKTVGESIIMAFRKAVTG